MDDKDIQKALKVANPIEGALDEKPSTPTRKRNSFRNKISRYWAVLLSSHIFSDWVADICYEAKQIQKKAGLV